MDQDKLRMATEDRRFRIVSMDPKLLVGILNWASNPDCVLKLPITPEIPQDCFVVSVNTSWDRGTVDVIIAHPDFDRSPPGMFIPRCSELATEFRVISLLDALNKQEPAT